MFRKIAPLGAVVMCASCVGTDGVSPPSEVLELPPHSETPDGTLTLRARDGRTVTLPYIEDLEGDRAVVGDVGFGPLDDVRQLEGRRGMGVIDLANRWTGGLVPFELDADDFDPALSPLVPTTTFSTPTCAATMTLPASSDYATVAEMCGVVDAVLLAMAEIEREVPGITFVERDPTDPAHTDHIRVTNPWYAMQGTCSFNWWGVAGSIVTGASPKAGNFGGPNALWIPSNTNASCADHELGHALGLWHEGGRADRNDHLFIDFGAMQPFWGFNYLQSSNYDDLGPFDFDSIMLYDSYDGAVNNNTRWSALPTDVAIVGGSVSIDATSLYSGVVYQTSTFDAGTDFDVHIQPDCTVLACAPSPPGEVTPSPDPSFIATATLSRWGLTASDPGVGAPGSWLVDRPGPRASRAVARVLGTSVFSDPEATFDRDHRRTFTGSTPLSPGDTSALYHLYGDTHDEGAPPQGNDAFGSAVTYGDFDGDGLVDQAVAVPGDDGGGGSVVVYRGLYAEEDTGRLDPMPWQRITAVGPVWSLAAGDLDDDGNDELIIGHDAAFDGRGEVWVYPGQRFNTFRVIDRQRVSHIGAAEVAVPAYLPSGWGTAPDTRFGFALAVGDLDDDGHDDLVVGAPGADATKAAGCPSTASCGSWTGAGHEQTGAVLVYRGVSGTTLLEAWGGADHNGDGSVDESVDADGDGYPEDVGALHPYHAAPGARRVQGGKEGAEFGASVAVGDLDGDGCDDIVVGAPWDWQAQPVGPSDFETGLPSTWFGPPPQQVGQAYVFKSTEFCLDFLMLREQVAANQPDGEFGAAVAVGNALLLSGNDVVVGAPADPGSEPGAPTGTGAVYVYPGDEASENWTVTRLPDAVLLESDFGTCTFGGDRFGETLAIGHLQDDGNPQEFVAVGAPSDNVTCDPSPPPSAGDGSVYLYRDTGSGLGPAWFTASLASVPTGTDRFGTALAFRALGSYASGTATEFSRGQRELAVGASGQEVLTAAGAGAVWRLEGDDTTVLRSTEDTQD